MSVEAEISDYARMFRDCEISLEVSRRKMVDVITGLILDKRTIYENLGRVCGIPWPLISAIHFRESALNFKCHLLNGDPLTDRTVHEPKGRPAFGVPPFLWMEAALDALADRHRPPNWGMAESLSFLENYNGRGYRARGIATPYLWSFTSYYTKGLYIFDGLFDPDKMDPRPGCVVILKCLEKKGVSLEFPSMANTSSPVH